MIAHGQRLLLLMFGAVTWQRICVVLVPALLCGGCSWYAIGQPRDTATALLVLVTVDLVGGTISNATTATNQQWQRQVAWHRWVFVVAHGTVYPFVIWMLAVSPAVRLVLLSVLIIKVVLFVRGSWRGTPPL